MTNTTLHLALGVGWLFGIPLLAIAMVASGLVPEGSPTFSAVASILWASGLISVFGSWALKDAPVHGKSRYVAATFTLMWLLLPVIAVFPYLFTTRGARQGLLASLKFVSLLFALGISWLAAFRLTGVMFA